jgi:CheY-like chemotaxis protein
MERTDFVLFVISCFRGLLLTAHCHGLTAALRSAHDPLPMPPVLLVDDDAAVRRTIARFLTFEGFVVVEACNGQEALTYLRTGAGASVIVLDLRMPVMDGWAFRREQRLDPQLENIPVVIMSGADADRFPELDAAAAFEKPVKMAQVAGAVRKLAGATSV